VHWGCNYATATASRPCSYYYYSHGTYYRNCREKALLAGWCVIMIPNVFCLQNVCVFILQYVL
jgi:hypothetical protein